MAPRKKKEIIEEQDKEQSKVVKPRKKKIVIDNSVIHSNKKKIVVDKVENLKEEIVNEKKENEEKEKEKEKETDPKFEFDQQKQISIGNMNIVVHTKNSNKNEVRKLFDKEQQNQHASILVQDQMQKLNKAEMTVVSILDTKINTKPSVKVTSKKELKDPKEVGVISKQEPLMKTIKHITKILDTADSRKGLCCFWCCHTFEGPNIPRPISYDKISNTFKVMGIFCSWACVASYSLEQNGKLEHVYQLKKLMDSCSSIEIGKDNDNDELIPAPPKLFLKIFGGTLSIEEFRNRSKIPGYRAICSENSQFSYIDQYLLEVYNTQNI